jgi:hypothetical protein
METYTLYAGAKNNLVQKITGCFVINAVSFDFSKTVTIEITSD